MREVAEVFPGKPVEPLHGGEILPKPRLQEHRVFKGPKAENALATCRSHLPLNWRLASSSTLACSLTPIFPSLCT
jgi:hypothetical protein